MVAVVRRTAETEPFAVSCLGLEHFKDVNDDLTHRIHANQ